MKQYQHSNNEEQQALSLLRIVFALVPIVAGIDKFTNLLTNWSKYLNTSFSDQLPISPTSLMMFVGTLEIIVGIVVFKKPEIGGYIIAGWLTFIAFTLLIGFHFVDIAMRDLALAASAFALTKLTKYKHKKDDEDKRINR